VSPGNEVTIEESSMTANPGLADQASKRTLVRALGSVFGIGGVLLLGYGFFRFASGIFGDSIDDGQMGQAFLMFAVGAFTLVIGAFFATLGFMGAAARYGAGETMPVVRDSASYVTDGEGILGVGRIVDDDLASNPATDPAKTGSFCSKCGVGNDEGARFCDACGTTLA
jgi:hypothetical protein